MKIEHDAVDVLDAKQLEGDAQMPLAEELEEPPLVTATAHFHLGRLGVHQIADGRWRYEIFGPDGPRVVFWFATEQQARLQAEDDLLFFEDYYMRQQAAVQALQTEEVKAKNE